MPEGIVSEVAGNIFGKLVSGTVWILIGVVLFGAVGFVIWWFVIYKRKFDIEVKVISKRAEDKNNIIFDKAAILTDRTTGKRHFRLWNFKVDLPVPKFEVLQRDASGKDFLDLYQASDEDFYFLTPPKIDQFRIIRSDGKIVKLANQKHRQMDTDIAYWNVKRKVAYKDIFSKESVLWKVLEMAPQMIAIVALIFILWIFLDKLPAVLSQLEHVASEINQFRTVEVVETTIASMLPFMFLKWKN